MQPLPSLNIYTFHNVQWNKCHGSGQICFLTKKQSDFPQKAPPSWPYSVSHQKHHWHFEKHIFSQHRAGFSLQFLTFDTLDLYLLNVSNPPHPLLGQLKAHPHTCQHPEEGKDVLVRGRSGFAQIGWRKLGKWTAESYSLYSCHIPPSHPYPTLLRHHIILGKSFFFGCAAQLAGSQFPHQGSNPCPLQWKHGVLTTGPPGNSPFLGNLDTESISL